MRKVILTMNENVKYETMLKTKAEVVLGLSRRQIDRLVNNYRKIGKDAFRHKNLLTKVKCFRELIIKYFSAI
jgi:hypothetical protein